MGFGSGGGFTPSPNNIPGSTKIGTDKDTDVHQFTGSVDITGSLTLNGSAITGGGGGGGSPGGSNSQVQYNNGGAFGGATAFVYDDGNNRVGIGATTPSTILHVSASDATDAFRVDTTDNTDNPALFVQGGNSLIGIGCADPQERVEIREDTDNEDVFLQIRGDGGGSGYAGVKLVRNIGSAKVQLKNEGTFPRLELRTDKSGAFPRPNVELHPGEGGAVLKAIYNTGIEITGSTKMSGAFGSTAIETLTAAGTLSAATGFSIIDVSSSGTPNTTYEFEIANGTFTGQEKKIYGKVISGSTAQLSTAFAITGSNIDSEFGFGQIVLSSSEPGGPLFSRGGCSLIWDGTAWTTVGNYNLSIF